MAWYIAFVLMRVLVTAFFFVTATYSLLNYSPFVFNQFIRPRIFWWVNEFAGLHYVWYCGSAVLCVVRVVPGLRSRRAPGTDDSSADASARADAAHHRLAQRLAIAFVVVFGIAAEWLLVTPYLPKLWNDNRS